MSDITDPHLPHALRILARDIHCEDGIATQAIREAADEIDRLRLTDAEREAVENAAYYLRVSDEAGLRCAVTLRGLLERLSDSTPISGTGNSAETANPPEWTSKPYYVDPPEGWRWGFPKLYDPAQDGDMRAWMIRNGYPQRLADQGLPCTFTACTDSGET